MDLYNQGEFYGTRDEAVFCSSVNTGIFSALMKNLLLSGSHAVMTITTTFTVRDKELIWHMGGKLGTEAMSLTSFREEQESLKSLRSLTKLKLGLEKIVLMLLFKSNSEKRYQL